MSMALNWGALLLIVLGCSFLVLHLARRPPQCPTCRTPAEPISHHHTDSRIPVVELAYWCPRCAQVISRRIVTTVWDW
jgi:hypothetical protein